MTRQIPADARRSPHLHEEIRSLLAPLHAMQQRHQEQLDVHRDADGEVIEGQYAEYENVRHDTAIEAADTLEDLVAQLDQLVADPPRRAYTLALRGPGHQEGARPWLFVVNATDRDDAHRALTQLPAFQTWLEDTPRPGRRRCSAR
ncbi:hypothetical protein [Streptomyces sp. NPDC059928]|uniref:hypothetical protein n=1 Tax=unclassified Streptomyces TaxID=2593676 RepID=UPI003656A419